MANGTEAAASKGKTGRQGRDKQEAVLQPSVVGDKIDQLEKLFIKAQEAQKDLSDSIKAVAEKSGFLASNIKKLVAARVGDKFADKKRDAEQQLELFNEVGE